MIVSIIFFFIIFSILVIGHEFGHFMVATRSGIRVYEFDVGMGPKLWSKRKGETDFCIRAFPFGGACIFEDPDGLDDAEDGEKQSLGEQMNAMAKAQEGDVHAFRNASIGARFATVLAGPVMNFLMGLVFAMITVAFTGSDLPVVAKVMPGYAAEEAGLEAGDTITKINGHSIHLFREISLYAAVNYGESMDVVYERDGQSHEVTLTPTYNSDEDRYYIGIYSSSKNTLECNALQVFQYGWYETQYWFRVTFESLGLIFRWHFTLDDISGPVGVVKVVDDTYQSSKSYGASSVLLSMLSLTTLLSINLGVMNLLPIPALDGGRLLLIIIELLRGGRKLSPEKEGYVTLAGAMALIALMVVVMFNDVAKFFHLCG